MTDRKVLIGDIVEGVVLHQQDAWAAGDDRLVDPDGRTLALLDEITEPGPIGSLGEVRTVYVDAEHTDEYTPDGSFSKPYTDLQDGINGLMALPLPDGGTEIHGVLRIAPSRKYLSQTGQLIMTLPSDSAAARRVALVADAVGGSNSLLLPPMRIDSPSNSSINFIAMRGLSFAGVSGGGADTVLHVKGHASFTGQLRFYLSDVQFNTNDKASDAFYVDAGGGSFGLFAVGHTNFVVKSGDTGNAIRMERGWMNLRSSNVWSGAAPAINLSGSASVTLMGGELTVTGGTNTPLVTLADTSSVNIRDVLATARGSGAVVSHTGAGGFISLYDVQLDATSTGGIEAMSGAPVLLGICTRPDGVPVSVSVASPAQIIRLVPGAQVAYADGSSDGDEGSAWATSAPVTIKDAIDRLATQLASHLGGAIPE